jgi:hypothetical protein
MQHFYFIAVKRLQTRLSTFADLYELNQNFKGLAWDWYNKSLRPFRVYQQLDC